MELTLTVPVINSFQVKVSDELDAERLLELFESKKDRYDTGEEVIEAVLEAYKKKFGFDYEIIPCGNKIEGFYCDDVFEE